jgi:hypothetical protein
MTWFVGLSASIGRASSIVPCCDAFHYIKVCKPSADAVVAKAYLLASVSGSAYDRQTIQNGDITLQARPVTWFDSVTNDAPGFTDWFHSVAGDVTGIVRSRMGEAPAGCTNFRLAEVNSNTYIDGEILAVVSEARSAASQNRDRSDA